MDLRITAAFVAFFVGGLVILAYRRQPRRNFALEQIRELVIDNNLKLANMPTKAEFQALAQEMRDAFANIAADITRLTDRLENGGLTPEEETEVFGEFRALADSANAIAGQTPEDEEPTEPVEPVE